MKPSLSSRADLIRALAYDNPELNAAMAELLGYNYDDTPVVSREQPSSPLAPVSLLGEGSREQTPITYKPADVPFWRLETFAAAAPVELPPEPEPASATDLVWRTRPTEIPDFLPLASPRAVLTELRKIAATRRTTSEIDVDTVVERLGRGDLLDQLPYRQRRAWGSTILYRSRSGAATRSLLAGPRLSH